MSCNQGLLNTSHIQLIQLRKYNYFHANRNTIQMYLVFVVQI